MIRWPGSEMASSNPLAAGAVPCGPTPVMRPSAKAIQPPGKTASLPSTVRTVASEISTEPI